MTNIDYESIDKCKKEVCELLGQKSTEVRRIIIDIEAGCLPTITIVYLSDFAKTSKQLTKTMKGIKWY